MEKILAKISELYGLQLKLENKVTKGFLSDNYVLTDGKTKYFLKKYRFEDPKRIKEIHLSKKYFSDGGIPVILPLPTRDGDTFFTINNENYSLFPFINGKQLERGQLTEAAGNSFAKTLAHIHLLGRDARLPIEEKFSSWDKNEMLERIKSIQEKIQEKTLLSDFDQLALEGLALKQKLVSSNTLTYEDLHLPSDHLIHGDYLEQNVFFHEDNTVSHVFDFEKSGYFPRSYELFRSMIYGFLDKDHSPEGIGRFANYINAYLEIYPMSKDEIKNGLTLFYLKAIHNTWVEKEHYLKNNNRVDEFLLSDFLRIQYLSESLDNLITMLA